MITSNLKNKIIVTVKENIKYNIKNLYWGF